MGHVRGHHKIFLGMAAGVGKTYGMLEEGRAELEAGRDVVIGYLEPLGRIETEQAAEGVEAKRLVREPPPVRDEHGVMDQAVPQAVGERLLAIVTPKASSQRVVRRAWRSAQRLGAELDILTVLAPGHEPTATEADQLGALRRLGSLLGAHVLIEQGDDVSEVVARVAEERGSTYVLMGTPAPRTGVKRFSEPLTERLMRRLPGVDLRVVADRSKRRWAPR